MVIATSRLQTPTEIVMDTQTEIKELIKYALVDVGYMLTFYTRLEKLLNENLAEIKNIDFRERARLTLYRYARDEYNNMIRIFRLGNLPLILLSAYNNIEQVRKEVNLAEIQKQLETHFNSMGKGEIFNGFSQLANSQAKTENGKSLFGASEMAMRYQEKQDMLEDLKQKTNLVIIDTHSDCSERCFKWQGRVYSLDGSVGTTEDGINYIPLEVATDVVDKYGYKNGLFGFNCRHKAYPYKKGVRAIKVSKAESKRNYKITLEQRALEREIRSIKDLANTFKDIKSQQDKYKFYKERARILTNEYEDFCRKNNRVIYRSRIQI